MTPAPNVPRGAIVREVERYITTYVALTEPAVAFPLALWVVGTYLWPYFDAFPYLVVTSPTKRSGKTRLMEVLSFLASNARLTAAMTAAVLFRSIRDESPTLMIDEAETLSREDSSAMRAVMNVGYRRGQMIRRVEGKKVTEWPTYCPKVFVLIGDVYDTLRDRSIVVTMRRAKLDAAIARFRWDDVRAEGDALRERLQAIVNDYLREFVDGYHTGSGAPTFMTDRDAEIWTPLFVACHVLCPERIPELQRIAADMTALKTQEARQFRALAAFEKDAEQEEYALRLLRDLRTVLGERRYIYTADALASLRELPTAPWRRFRSDDGLNPYGLSDLLNVFKVKPRLIKAGGKVARGYRREDVERALRGL